MSSLSQATRVASRLYTVCNTPVSLSCLILLRYKEWDQLATKATDPHAYLDTPSGIEKYRRDAIASSFLRKYEDLPTSIDKIGAALDSFHKCESECAQTNYRLEYLQHLATSSDPPRIASEWLGIVRSARKICSRILGPLPQSLEGGFGPGTSFELRGQVTTTLADKMWVTPHVTSAGMPVFRHMYEHTLWARTRVKLGLPFMQLVRGNRFTTVPKDGKTHRGICVEPLGNLYAQLAVGRYMKGRLSAVGIHIDRSRTSCPLASLRNKAGTPTGESIHRNLAREASVTGEFSTIDLSNASDTMSLELVRQVLPPDWFSLLSSLRSSRTLVNGTWHHLHKFSSMGNGFTFELETLLFGALIGAVTKRTFGRDFWVYGDDIIVPSDDTADVLAVLSLAGFTPNVSKSFSTSGFRESCGGDYFNGVDVRPLFLKKSPSTPQAWASVYNGIRARFPSSPALTRTLNSILDCVPTRWRLFGPPRAENLVFHGPARRWSTFRKDGILWLNGFAERVESYPLDRWGDEFTVALALLGVPSSGLALRGGFTRTIRAVTSIS